MGKVVTATLYLTDNKFLSITTTRIGLIDILTWFRFGKERAHTLWVDDELYTINRDHVVYIRHDSTEREVPSNEPQKER